MLPIPLADRDFLGVGVLVGVLVGVRHGVRFTKWRHDSKAHIAAASGHFSYLRLLLAPPLLAK